MLAACLHRNCRVCVTPTKEFGQTGRGLVYNARDQQSTVEACSYWREQRARDSRGIKTLCAQSEKVMSQYYTAELALTLGNTFSNRFGIHAMAPLDILHTVPHGIVELIKDILLLFTGACTVLAVCVLPASSTKCCFFRRRPKCYTHSRLPSSSYSYGTRRQATVYALQAIPEWNSKGRRVHC